MNIEQITNQLKKDTNNSLSASHRANQVFHGLISYSEALQLCNGNIFYKTK